MLFFSFKHLIFKGLNLFCDVLLKIFFLKLFISNTQHEEKILYERINLQVTAQKYFYFI